MAKIIGVVIVMAAGVLAGIAHAEAPGHASMQMGLYLSKSFGHTRAAPVSLGFKLDRSSTYSDFNQQLRLNAQPSILDIRFNKNGLNAFSAAGVNVLKPSYMLGAEEEGFLSGVNWGLVGLGLFGAGIYYLAEEDRDDREERIARHEADTADGSAVNNE